MFLPDRVDRFVAFSVGHFGSFFDAGLEQREKSWYMLYFQYEGIAEDALRENDWKLFRDWTRNHPELATWIPELSRPGALTAALNWYRANVNPARPGLAGMEFPPVKAPTLGVLEHERRLPDRDADDRVQEVHRPASGATSGSKAPATGSCSISPNG